MSCSDRIVRVTYPKNCCPEVDDSQQLLYNGPALQCINVQTNQAFNEAIKEIDALICKTIDDVKKLNVCFTMNGEGFGGFSCIISPEPNLLNGKPYYKALIDDCVTQWEGGPGEFYYIWWSNSGTFTNKWVVSPLNNASAGNVYCYLSDSSSSVNPIGAWSITDISSQYFVTNSNFNCSTTII